MKSVSFTGHRILKITPSLREKLCKTLEKLIENGAENFYAGGAVGWDTLCAETLLQLKEKYAQIKLHLVLPCPPDEQTAKFNARQREIYRKILLKADSIEICSEHYFNGCMKIRNERLSQLGSVIVCYCSNTASGTGQTVSMALKNGAEIINLCETY